MNNNNDRTPGEGSFIRDVFASGARGFAQVFGIVVASAVVGGVIGAAVGLFALGVMGAAIGGGIGAIAGAALAILIFHISTSW